MTITDDELSKERFGFTVFFSVCIHTIIILGVGFTYLEELNSKPALEITVAQYRSEFEPEEADFLAQENQIGSGNIEERTTPSTPFDSDFNDDVIQEIVPFPSSSEIVNEIIEQDLALVASVANDNQERQLLEKLETEEEQPLSNETSSDDLSLAIASLQAQLDLRRQAYAKRPRRYTISSASTRKRQDALYLNNWRRRIEAVGNINYPTEARRQQIYGSLRMLVALLPDGQVDEIRILQSSEHSVLDDAAVEIVHLASPFDPFPEAIRAEADILEIIRTWRFHEGNALTSF
ncbi:MAG: energy transducer TonB [Pseudohongiellaceae bacterium]